MVDVDTILRQQRRLAAQGAPTTQFSGPAFYVAIGAIAFVAMMYFVKKSKKRKVRQ